MKNIILIGYRACGKTSIGKHIADITKKKFVDIDNLIEKKANQNIADIFKCYGEKHFRELETEILFSIRNISDVVISTGGGIVESEHNRSIIKNLGFVVWLKAFPQTIYNRIVSDKLIRPPLTNLNLLEEIEFILKKRNQYYSEIANFIIDTDYLTIEECANEIIGYVSQ